MPYKYIGKTTNFKGKTLWEIVGNLKNFGIGRLVIRSTFERYPEPSFFKILKVEPLPCPKVQTLDDQRKVRVLVEKTFRGVTYPKPITIESTSYKADYQLIPKDEEHNYSTIVETKREIAILQRTMEFPPLMKDVLMRENRAKGEDVQDLKLEIVYHKTKTGKYRVAEEGETPTVTFQANIQELPNISLYKNVKLQQCSN
ncbi:uncharacterized protein LOC123014364 [Tribolium madens]|uniref:uncharacterized protein LOC123014364 n=1 Tax=Tribolium madens TaxID=41895 RepID=UPI001CF751E0|nr:uncharacterized protein LOC123014364 [Tribolium madens]